MSWITKQPRMTQLYAYVVAQLNDVGVKPAGAVIKPWIRQELVDYDITADRQEIAMILSGLFAEGAITQSEINTLLLKNNAQSSPAK